MSSGAAEAVINHRDVDPELAEVLGFELPDLQFGNDVPQLLDVEKQKVDVEVIALDVEVPNDADAWPRRRDRRDDTRTHPDSGAGPLSGGVTGQAPRTRTRSWSSDMTASPTPSRATPTGSNPAEPASTACPDRQGRLVEGLNREIRRRTDVWG